MKIGIDISQIAYENTGVANYLDKLIENVLKVDQKNTYILFFSSLRSNIKDQISKIEKINPNVQIKTFKLPVTFLDILWNRLHILPIEWFIGEVDLFITSDWTEPPAKRAKKATIIYDLIVYKYPKETDSKIVNTQKKKLEWVKKESDIVFCISNSTKKDVVDILKIDENKIRVLYPGV